MGFVAWVLSFTRAERNGANVSDVKANPGGGPNVTSVHFGPAGDDSQPLPGDALIGVEIPGSGRAASVGYADPLNVPIAAPGDKRIYARFEDGSICSELWLQNDETVTLFNASGYWRLTPSGLLELNGAADYAVRYNAMLSAFNQLKSEVNAALTLLSLHAHVDPQGGSTGPGPALVDAEADMTGAKVEEVLLP